MTTLNILFKAVNTLALAGWLHLVLAPNSKSTRYLLSRPIIPGILAAAYPILLFLGRSAFQKGGGFGSLDAVSWLFQNRMALFGGWLHYLAFDLLVGTWIVSDARKRGIRHWLIIPALILTFLFGPAGWLTYQLERLLLRAKIPADTSSPEK